MSEPEGLAGVVSEPVDLAAAIQQAVLAVPGVVDMSPGRGFTEATYGPGITIHGIGMGAHNGEFEVSVHVIAAATPLPHLVQRLRSSIGSIVRERTGREADAINLYIDDIALGTGFAGVNR